MTTQTAPTEWYVRPEDCAHCYAQETIGQDYGIDWTVETTHESNCRNHPANAQKDASVTKTPGAKA
jgi:hypothetical protein